MKLFCLVTGHGSLQFFYDSLNADRALILDLDPTTSQNSRVAWTIRVKSMLVTVYTVTLESRLFVWELVN